MIQILILLSTITFSTSPACDSLKIKLYCRDECKDTIGINNTYYFTMGNSSRKFKVNQQTGVCNLPFRGLYKLHLMENEYPLTYNVVGQQVDTINYPKIYFGVSGITDVYYSNYINCNKVANGYLIDYFKEKKKRCEGRFKNGRLIGKLIYYDLNGKIVKTEQDPRNKKKLGKSINKNKNIRRSG